MIELDFTLPVDEDPVVEPVPDPVVVVFFFPKPNQLVK